MIIAEPTPYDYFNNKSLNKTYISKALPSKFLVRDGDQIIEETRTIRIMSKVMEIKETHSFIKNSDEVRLRITPSEKQEIIAKFYEDTRDIFTLQFQKYTLKNGSPHNTSFSFSGQEIETLITFLKSIPSLKLDENHGLHLNDKELHNLILNKDEALKILTANKEVFIEVVNNDISLSDLIALKHKKEQLLKFERLLSDNDYFEEQRKSIVDSKQNKTESIWQDFFEQNTWIFGYGLNYIFNSPIEDKKLEQVVSGNNFNSAGKRIDALMKTRGIISAFCFGEIKTHKTPLLKKVIDAYRRECWATSDELSGAIAQVQKTVQKSIKDLSTKIEIKDKSGNLTGEQVFMYQPKSFVIIGNQNEFKSEFGINEDKYSSFELFRQNINNPEIITFDELLERAKYIVEHIENK
jgi:hypothetical protein